VIFFFFFYFIFIYLFIYLFFSFPRPIYLTSTSLRPSGGTWALPRGSPRVGNQPVYSQRDSSLPAERRKETYLYGIHLAGNAWSRSQGSPWAWSTLGAPPETVRFPRGGGVYSGRLPLLSHSSLRPSGTTWALPRGSPRVGNKPVYSQQRQFASCWEGERDLRNTSCWERLVQVTGLALGVESTGRTSGDSSLPEG